MIDRVFTKAEARYIPNGDGSTADMAHPTRTGDVVVFSYPPYQFDAATPGTLIARSAFFGQHGYVPDIQDLKSNTNMRATFLAGGDAIERGVVARRPQHRPRPDGGVPARHPGAPAQPGRGAARPARRRSPATPRCRSSGSPTSTASSTRPPPRSWDATPSRVRSRRSPSVAPGNWRRCSTRRRRTFPARRCCWRRATTSGRHRRTRRCSRTCRRSTSRTCGGSTPRATATTSSTSASNASCSTGAGRLPVPRRQHRRGRPPVESPVWLPTSTCSTVNGVQVGVIGADVQNTPELVKAGATEGLMFLDEASASTTESEKLLQPGHRGAGRRDPRRRQPSAPTRSTASRRRRGRARSSTSSRRCRTRRSTSSSPGTRTASPTPSSATSRWSRGSTPAAATRSPS